MNSRDIYGDGHGFRPFAQKTKRVIPPPIRGRYNYDVTQFPRHQKPFIGLYEINGQREAYIIWRARKVIEGLQFLTGEIPHYIGDPIAWQELPLP